MGSNPPEVDEPSSPSLLRVREKGAQPDMRGNLERPGAPDEAEGQAGGTVRPGIEFFGFLGFMGLKIKTTP